MLRIFPPVKRIYTKPLKVVVLMEERQFDRRDGRQGDWWQGDLLPSGDIPQRRIRRSRKNVNPTATKSINITDNVIIIIFTFSRPRAAFQTPQDPHRAKHWSPCWTRPPIPPSPYTTHSWTKIMMKITIFWKFYHCLSKINIPVGEGLQLVNVNLLRLTVDRL